MTTLAILISILLVSLLSLIGVLILAMNEKVLQKILLYLVSFSTGAMLGTVFLHLLPEVEAHSSSFENSMALVLLGIVMTFVIEKFIHWHHCHNVHCKHVHPVGTLVLFGDAMHNILDGILIATAYMVSIPVGIAATVAVILHEIPQEIGDFSVLIFSGFTKKKALLWNFLSAITAFIGAFIAMGLSRYVQGIELIILPIAAGHFLYIAGSDLIPELHKEKQAKQATIQLITMIAGILLMYSMSMTGGHAHASKEECHHNTHAEEGHVEHGDHN